MNKTNLTTLCYIEHDGCYLMMHRVKKKNDINHDKWIGVGGHFEHDESPEECLLRETYEETGLVLDSFHLRGIITFQSDHWQTEYMFLYTADAFHGTLIKDCREGELRWIHKENMFELPLWEGDRIFFRLMEMKKTVFSLKLRYEGNKLIETILDGTPYRGSNK